MTIAPYLLGLAIFCAVAVCACQGTGREASKWKLSLAIHGALLFLASLVFACVPGGL